MFYFCYLCFIFYFETHVATVSLVVISLLEVLLLMSSFSHVAKQHKHCRLAGLTFLLSNNGIAA